ncbi:WD40 repeat domain-containing serine/threonine-protein kinase [Spirillospora sp. NPDC048832]
MEPLVPGDPRQLGHFYLDGRLGAGGQGVVYEGYGPDGERVAIKALHGMSDRDRSLLRKETWAWRQVASFCTAKVLHADLDGPIPFVVSEHVAGPDLRRAVERGGPYGPQELRRLAIGVAAALVAIHQAKVVHRDLKPENILLGPDGPRVIDFGLARIEELPTTTGVVKGTLRYMPPERYNGRRGDAKVDVWGWGAVVLFAATGRHAFDGETGLAIQAQVATCDPDTSMLAEPLRSLVSAALSKAPEDRPDSEDLLFRLVGGGDLTEAKEKAAGGHAPRPVAPSRAELAETVFASLGARAQEAVPQMLLRLVAPGERAEDTLRSARRTDFADGRIDKQVLERVLEDFTEAGILAWEGERVTLCSAALIRAWPRLRGWVEAERDGLSVHQDLADASRLWDGHGRKNSDLYQGTALARAQSWAATGRYHLTLNTVERGFLDAAAALARRRGRLRVLVSAVLAVLLVITTGAAAVAMVRGNTVARQRDEAVGVRIAGVATQMRRHDPATAKQLAVAALSLAPERTETQSALLALYSQWEQFNYRPPGVDGNWQWSHDQTGRVAAAARHLGHEVKIIDVDARRVTRTITLTGEPIAESLTSIVSLTGDGKAVSVVRKDGSVSIYDTATGMPWPVTVHIPEPYAQLNSTGTRLLGAEFNPSRVKVWDTATGKLVLAIPHDLVNVPAVFTPDGKSLIRANGTSLETWDLDTGKKAPHPLLVMDGTQPITDLGISPDGKILAVRLGGRLWDVRRDELDKIGKLDRDGKIDQFTARVRVRAIPSGAYGHIGFSSDGRFLNVGSTIWETDSFPREPVFDYTSEHCGNHEFVFGPGDRTLRCVYNGATVLSLGTLRDPVQASRSDPAAAAISADGSTLAVQDFSEDALVIWDARKRARRGTLPLVSVFSDSANGNSDLLYKLSSDGRFLANVRRSGDIEIWDVATASRRTTLKTGQRLSGDTPVAFSPDGKTLAVVTLVGYTTQLDLWDVPSGKLRATSTGLRRGAASVIATTQLKGRSQILFSADGKTVIPAPDQGVIDVATGRRLATPPSDLAQPMALSRNGLVADHYFRDAVVKLWDGRALRRLPDIPIGGRNQQITSMKFSPDGRLLAVVGAGDQIRLWDAIDRRPYGQALTGFVGSEILALAFTPDGSTIVALDDKGRLRTHLIALGEIGDVLCVQFGSLSRTAWKAHIPEIPYRRTC